MVSVAKQEQYGAGARLPAEPLRAEVIYCARDLLSYLTTTSNPEGYASQLDDRPSKWVTGR